MVAATASTAATPPSTAPATGTAGRAAALATTTSTPHRRPLRLAYAEALADEQAATCAGFIRRAGQFFAAHGITIQRILTDNAMAYRRSTLVRAVVAELGAAQRFTRPYHPQTNGKVERFNRTLLVEWAYQRPYLSNTERTAALDGWLHTYKHHRAHTALGGHPPISRTNNPANSYI